MKKRIIALVFACMLICSLAVTATAAAELVYTGRYENIYFYNAYVESMSIKAYGMLECFGCPYNLRVDLIVETSSGEFAYNGTDSLELATNVHYEPGIRKMTARYCIKNQIVYTKAVTN